MHVSAGEGGIWGVSRGHNIYYRWGKQTTKMKEHQSILLHSFNSKAVI